MMICDSDRDDEYLRGQTGAPPSSVMNTRRFID
jgi:hypothetical protein